MSDTIKLIIEIPQDFYEITKDKVAKNMTNTLSAESIAKGVPLDDIKAEIKGLSGFYYKVTGIREMDTVRSVLSDVNSIIDKHVADLRGDRANGW